MKRYLLTLAGVLALSSQMTAQEYLDDIMLQSFGWDEYAQPRISTENGLYEFYNTRAGNLKANGFDMIWLPPPSHSSGGVGYFPTELFNFSLTSWGTEAQLVKMLTNMNSRGLYPIADVVANHRNGTADWTTFTNPNWGCDAITIDDEATAAYDNGVAGVGCRPSGARDTGDGFEGSRDMDHTNPTVRNGYKEYLTRLKNLGFKGWRWDVAKGFSPEYFGEYIGASQPYYSVGEYWDPNVTNLKNWINGTYAGGATISGAFDFALYNTLSRIIQENASNNYATLNNSGAMAGLAGQYGFAEKAVTFVDNHDTFVHNSGFQGNNIMVAYAYILTHPGIPSVFAPHYYGGTYSKDGITKNFGNGYATAINKLTAIRKATGINAYSHITINDARAGLYSAYIKKSANDAEPVIAMKIGPYSWTPTGSDWVVSASGTNYTVWTKTAVNTPPTIAISPAENSFNEGETKTVTLSASDDSGVAPTIRYTLDGSEPTANSPIYRNSFTVNNSTTVKAAAFDNEGLSSGVLVKDYTFKSLTNGINIRFNPEESTWSQPYIHYWGATPAGSYPEANWGTPVPMTADANFPGWYIYSFPNVQSINFLFRNGSNTGILGETQTADITNVTEDSWYVWDANSGSFVRKVVGLSTDEINANNKTQLQIVQNPATNGELKVKYANAKDGTITMFDVSGRLVKTFKLSNNSGTENFSINGLKSGVYILQLKSDNGNTTAKVMIK
ncbi:MAG: chitobiase/beta-hexosaminidase C-terminal domain-containing protein [Cruoricaptor ignavus]|nr:chitobiase/beta-hexosaminidase C-terminal domain-containing protein [Cruoricaptor ignavus]